jgi:hypothetical protein
MEKLIRHLFEVRYMINRYCSNGPYAPRTKTFTSKEKAVNWANRRFNNYVILELIYDANNGNWVNIKKFIYNFNK